ncbi:hypothetical protein BLNAU_3074 [Blattamonas nauphoetae]|uniref:Uncharacterized protein n=1 Tax=Blattamonas nauphoetae TaxID=2049346 RepID=A0ABQ9YEA3_9EUKA|nr:hypothetical protein BLNAU_3074 [Blattamonas nauphoetae]
MDSISTHNSYKTGPIPPDLASPYSQSSQQHHRNLNSVVSNELSIARQAPSPPSLSLDGVYEVSEMLLSNTEMTLIGSSSCHFIANDASANSPHLFRLTNTTLSLRSIKFDLAKDLSYTSNVEKTAQTHQPSIASLAGSTLSTDNCSFVFVGGESLFVLSSPTTATAETANHLTIKNCRLDLIAQTITPLCTVQDSIQPLSSHSVAFVGNTLSSLQVHSNTGFLFANANEHSPQISSTISDAFLANISRTDATSLPRVSPMTIAERVVKSQIEDALDIFDGSLFAPLESQHAFSCINTSFTQCINADTHQHNPSNYTFVGQTYDPSLDSDRFKLPNLTSPILFIACTLTTVDPTANSLFLNLQNNEDDVTIRSCSFTANTTSSFYARFLWVSPLPGTFATLTIDDLTCLYGVANEAVNEHTIIFVLSSMNVILTGSTFTSPTDRSNTRAISLSSGTYVVHVFGCVFSNVNVKGNGGIITQSSGGDLNVADCLFENNKVSGVGGCVSVHRQCLSFFQTIFKQNSATRGGAIAGWSLTTGLLEDCHFEGNTATEGQHYSGNDIFTDSGGPILNALLVIGCTSTSSAPKISYYSSALVNGVYPQAEILLPDPSTKTDYEHKLSVAADGSGSTCSEAVPCQTVADALLTFSTTGRNRVLIGTGTFSDATRTVSGSVELVGNGWVRDSSFFTTVVSGGMKVGSGGNVTLRSMTLLPSTATTIVVGMSEEGVLRLSFIRIDEISSHSSSLISISKGTTTLFRCWFDKVNLTSSAFVSVSGSASLHVLGTYFMLITRTNGEGASCIDSESSGRIDFDSSDFGNCSSSGVAGALNLKGTTTSAYLKFVKVYFFYNKAKMDSTTTNGTVLKAHDMVVEGFSSNRISTTTVSSFSPQISYLRLGVPTRLSPLADYGFAANGISFPLAGKYFQGVPLVQFSSIKEMIEQTYKHCSSINPLLNGLTVPLHPLLAEDVQVRWRSPIVVASTSSETLVTVGKNAVLQFVDRIFIFNAIPSVTPFVVRDSTGTFVFSKELIEMNCTVTPLTIPLFSLSAGTVTLSEVTLPILSFADCAMIEGTGGTIKLEQTTFPQITSTGNGSVVHATSTIVTIDGSKFEGCQSKNGGAIWFEATGTNYLQVIHPTTSTYSTTFENCEAAERGGAICVEGSSSISNPISFFTDKINHARFSGNKATVSGNDVFVGKSVFGSKTISEIGSFGGGSLSDWFHVVIEDLGKTEEEKVDIGLLIPLPTVSVNGSVKELTTGMSGTNSEECKWTSTFCATLGYAMNSLRSKQDGKYIEMKTQFVWNMTYTEQPMNVSDQNVKLTGTTASDQTKCNTTRTIVEMDSKSTAGSALFTIENNAVFSVSNMDLKIREGHGLFVVASTGDSLRIENCGMIASSGSTLSESVICVNGGSLELVSSLLNTTELPSCSLSEALISVNSATANVVLDTVSICGFSFSSSSLVHLATETSMTVKHVTFERCIPSLGTGHLVLVEGTNLQTQISPPSWEGTFSETTPMESLWGKDSTLSSSLEWNEASLLFYLFRPVGKIVAGGTGNKASTHPFCGSKQLICSTLESAHTSLRDGLNTVWIESDISLISKLEVVTSATLTSSTSTKRVVSLTKSGMVEVDGNGITVTMKLLIVCFDSSSISPTLFAVKCGTLDVDECVIGGSSSENALVLSSFVTSLISVGQAGIVDLGSSKISNVVFGHSSEGSAVVVENGGSLVVDSSDGEMKKFKPEIPEIGFFSLEERKKLAGSVNGVVESILYEWYERESGVIHVRREGVDAVKGGHACLPQQTLSFCLTQLVSGGKIVIDSSFSLAEALEQPNSEITISANTQKNEEVGVEVEVVELGSFSISQGHLTVSSVSFSTVVKAGPFMRVSNAGSLSIASCSFSGFWSASSGSVVSASLGEANTLSITSSQFSNCKSDLSGGVIHLLLSSATESSQIEMKGTFSECSCGNGMKGDWVFVEGTNLENQISPANWEGTFSEATPMESLWGKDSTLSSSSEWDEASLLFYLFRPVGKIVAGGTGNKASTHPFCGSKQLICSTLESAHTSLRDGLNTVWIESDISLISKLEVVTSATLTSSTSTKRVVSLTKSGMVEVDGNGITVTMKLLIVCFDSSSISPTLFAVKCGTLDVDECVIGGSSSENALVLSSFVTSLISVGQAGIVDLGSSKISNVVFGHSSEGSAVVVENGGSLVVDSSDGEMKKFKPEIPEIGFFSLEERKKLAGSVNGVVESILYEWYERESGVIHVRREGVDAVKGGHACLPQQTLSFCLTQLVSGGKIVIDSSFSLAEALEQPNSEITISANTQKNEEVGVEVEVVELGSFSISQGHLTVSSVSFSTVVKAGPFMRVSNAGSLSIASCSFSGFWSASSGSVVSASLGEANTLSITSSQFSNCKSDLCGGVIHLLLSSATESSQIEMKGTFSEFGKIVAGGTGNKASTHPFCGSKQLICSTLESAHTSLRDGLNTVWIESDISLISKLEVVTSATLTSSTSTKRVVSLTKSGMVEVDGNGITVTMKLLIVCFDSSSISPTLFAVKCGTLDVDECVIGGSSSENALVLSSFVTSLISVGQAGIVDLGSSKISNVVFGHSSEGSAVVVENGGSLVVDSSECVSSIRSNGTGSHLLMIGDTFASIAGSGEMKKFKPEIPEIGFFSLEERKKLAGSVNGVVESILYEWYERESGVIHVRREGVDAVKGGHACLPQQTLSFCLTQLVSGGKIVIDSSFSLAEALEQPNSEITISANTQKNEEVGVEVEVVELGSFSISQGHLTVSSVSFSTVVKAGPFMRVSNAGSLSIASCSFSGFWSASSGSVVSASLGEANTLSITSSQFSNCKSDLCGGVIHLLLSSATESSQIVMKGTFSECSCGNGMKGDWVFVEGTNLENQIDTQSWSGHPTLFGDVNENRMWGSDSSDSSPIFSSSTLLVYLVETTLDEVFVSSLGKDVKGCGFARLPCKTISSSTSHLLNTTTSQVTLQTASTLTGEVVNSWNHLIVCGDEQTSIDVLVSLSGHFSVPIHELSLSFIRFDTNEGCFATSLISLSGSGSLSVDSCSFRSFHSSSSGSIVCGTVSSSSFLSLTESSFSSCKSDGDGGVIWVRCEESVGSSSLVVNCSFDSSCGCGSGCRGEWVFVEGFGFEDLISASNWERTSSSLSSPTHDSLLFGVDQNETESSSFHSLSLLYYLTEFRASTIFVGSNGRDSNGCGHSERLCKRLERGHAHLKGMASLELFVIETVSLTSVVTFAPNNLVITSQIGRGTVNVEGEGSFPRWRSDRDSHSDGEPALLRSGCCDMLDAVHHWSWPTDSDLVFVREVGCV